MLSKRCLRRFRMVTKLLITKIKRVKKIRAIDLRELLANVPSPVKMVIRNRKQEVVSNLS